MARPTGLAQGTLDLLILRSLALHSCMVGEIAQRIRQVLKDQGARHPVLHRLEQQGSMRAKWGECENNRRAKCHSLTPEGLKCLHERAPWKRLSVATDLVLDTP